MRFTLDLWPEYREDSTPSPQEMVQYVIEQVRDHGENFSWDIRDDLTDKVLHRDVRVGEDGKS